MGEFAPTAQEALAVFVQIQATLERSVQKVSSQLFYLHLFGHTL